MFKNYQRVEMNRHKQGRDDDKVTDKNFITDEWTSSILQTFQVIGALDNF